MGRQTAVAMTRKDEKKFLDFLRSGSEIALLESQSPTKEAMWVECFAPTFIGHWQYFIWNKAFPWEIEYGQITPNPFVTNERAVEFYIENSSTAPLIEYDRHNFKDKQGLSYGRVYWAKYFSAPDGVTYDVNEFSKWYNSVVRWIRKNGKRQVGNIYSPYFLPDAWEKYGKKA